MSASSPRDAAEGCGRLVYGVRPTPTARVWVVGVALGIGALGLGAVAPPRTWWTALAALAGYVVAVGLIAASGFLDRHRVHEDAVLLGTTWPGATPFVVPVSSIDPGSLVVHERANQVNRRLHMNGTPTMRMAIYSTRAVSFVGLGPAGGPARWVLGVRDPEPLVAALVAVLGADPALTAEVMAHRVEEPTGRPVVAG